MLRATILRASSAPADVTTDDQLVRIAVAENPTTGYRWVLSVHPPGLVEVEVQEFEPPADRAAGAAGRRLFVLRADRPGTGIVELALVRSWQPDAPADSLLVRLDA